MLLGHGWRKVLGCRSDYNPSPSDIAAIADLVISYLIEALVRPQDVRKWKEIGISRQR